MIKSQEWKPYKRKAKVIEINIKDNDEQTLDFYKLYNGNTRDIRRIVNILKQKYDFDLFPIEVEDEKKWLSKDLNW